MQPQELWVTVLLQYRALSLMHTSACFCTLLFSLLMISNTSLYYIIGHESLNKTSRRKSSMRWSFDALFCSPGRVVCVCVCMYAWFCMSANTQRVCGSCTYRSVTDSWWEFSDSRSRCWPLFQRKTSKRRHCSVEIDKTNSNPYHYLH